MPDQRSVNRVMSFSLKVLGGIALAGERGPVTGPAVQRHRLALLSLLATAHPRAVSRDKLLAWLWPERESEPARRLLNQAVHALRQALGAEAIVSAGDDLQLDIGVVHCDVVAFEEALAGGAPERAVALYTGPFLDGFFLDDAPEFERWVDRERDRLAGAYAKALEGLAEAAERGGDSGAAMEWWKARAAHDPYDSRVALRVMQVLERAGNRAGALQHAMLHQQLLRDELEMEPDPEIHALVERLRRVPAPAVAPRRAAADHIVGGTDPPPVPSPAEVTRDPAPHDPAPGVLEAPAWRRRLLWYGVTAILLAAASGGAIRLAARGGGRPAVASPGVDEIARAVAQELERRQRGDTAVRLPRHRTRSIAAYELYLRGEDPTLIRSDSGARRGLEYFQRALALDSTYAAAWVGLARLTYRASDGGPAARAAAKIQAEAALRKALALDDSLPEAHALMGVFRGMDYDWASAEQHFRRALSLQPTSPRTREWFVQFLLMTGRREEALAEAERAVALNPMSPSTIAELARALAANDRCEEALARLETIKDLDPPLLRVPAIAERCHARQGHWADAIAALLPQAESDSTGSALALLGYMRGRAGQREEALSIQARLLDRWRRGLVGAMKLAYVPAALGDRDEAFAWLDRALEDGSLRFAPGMWVDLTDVPFDALWQDPRMDRLRERFGYQKR
jgi:DNA-binding SARP family transcriptional activator/Tfp pilus assembly protein PilF